MYDHLHFFEMNGKCKALALPFDIEEIIQDWEGLRKKMIKQIPDPFIREEWAYLISFLENDNLTQPLKRVFGKRVSTTRKSIYELNRPRGMISLWLPNNVSLLGPLMLILLSLTGNSLRIKTGSRSEDLAGSFLDFAIAHLGSGPLMTYLVEKVIISSFDKDDEQNQEMAKLGHVRIVFGSDETAAAIDSLPHPVESPGFYFFDRRSEAWIEKAALDDKTVGTLIKVFAIYGQAGCTSPSKVVVIDGNEEIVSDLKARIVKMWPQIISEQPSQHIASSNILAYQHALAIGWDADLTELNSAVIAAGTIDHQMVLGPMTLPIICADLESALNHLPDNIQTIGYALQKPNTEAWLANLGRTKVKRFVPISNMHHFGHVWDGYPFWSSLFEQIEVQL